jgi:O-antigen ligase
MHLDPVPRDASSVSDIYVVSLIAFSGIALYAAEGIRRMADLLRIIRTFVAGAAVMCLIAILQARLNFDATDYIAKLPFLTTYGEEAGLVSRGSFGRPAGTASHPIEFGVVTGLALAFAIYLSLHDRAWPKLGRWSAVALIGLGIPVAVSRSAIVVAVAVLAAFFATATRQARARVLPVFFAMIVAVFLVFPGMLGTLTRLFAAGRSDSSIADRVRDYAFVEAQVESSLWLGHGPGSLPPEVRILDNQYLLSLVEIGLVGVLALFVLFGAIWMLGRGGRRRFVDEGDRLLGQMLAAGGLGIILAAFTYDGLSFPMFKASIALFLGLAGRYWTLAREEEYRLLETAGNGGRALTGRSLPATG